MNVVRHHPRIDTATLLAKVKKRELKHQRAENDLFLIECAVRLNRYPGVVDYDNRDTMMRSTTFTHDIDKVYVESPGGKMQSLMLCAVMDMLAHRLFVASDTPNRFLVAEGLAYELLATEVKGVVGADVRLPCAGFLLSIPEGVITLQSHTGTHPVTTIAVFTETDGTNSAMTLVLLGGSASNDMFDNQVTHMSMPLVPDRDIDATFEERLASDDELRKHWTNTAYGTVHGEEVTAAWMRTFVARYVVNFLLYVNSERADVKHVHADAIAKLKGVRKVDKERKQRLEVERTFVVGTSVTVNPDIVAAVREGKTASTLTYRTLVRGHWRKQACGSGRADRRLTWIKPHVRGTMLPDVTTAGHDYRVG